MELCDAIDPRVKDGIFLPEMNVDITVERIVECVARYEEVSNWMAELLSLVAAVAIERGTNTKLCLELLHSIVYREKLPSNKAPIVPTKEPSAILQVVLGMLQEKTPLVTLTEQDIWKAMLWPLSADQPQEIRCNVVQCILQQGCVVLLKILFALFRYRRTVKTLNHNDICSLFKLSSIKQSQKRWRIVFTSLSSSTDTQLFDTKLHVSWSKLFQTPRDKDKFLFKKYDYIGFDIDGTLVKYASKTILAESFEFCRIRMLEIYPSLADYPSPRWLPDIAHRSIAIDIDHGNLILLMEDESILHGFHGSVVLSPTQLRQYYPQGKAPPSVVFMYTIHDVVFAPIFAWLVDAFDAGIIHPIHQADTSAYRSLASAVRNTAVQYHNQVLEHELTLQPGKWIHRCTASKSLLHQWSKTHQLFIITNATWDHADVVLTQALGTAQWQQYFAFVITSASKETFFRPAINNPPRPFLRLVEDGPNAFVPTPLPIKGPDLRYMGGHVSALLHAIGTDAKVCYIGDHRVHDIELPREHCGWDTVAVLEELGTEPPTHRFLPWKCALFPIAPIDNPSPPRELGYKGDALTFVGHRLMQASIVRVDSIAKLACYTH